MKQKLSVVNKKSKFEYEFLETLTAGIQLVGNEIKTVKQGKFSVNDAFCFFKGDELFIKNMVLTNKIDEFSPDIKRDKKLLLKRKEINNLKKELTNGLTIIVYKVFENEKGLIKVEICLARGKKLYDKRNTIKEREANRDKKFVEL
jgi:SsrA-binding protein